MQTFRKKFLATLLVLCMLLSFVPFGTLAAESTAIAGRQLSLGDDLTMHFFVNVEEQYQSSAVVTVAAGGGTAQYRIGTMTPSENGAYDCYIALGAPQMTEEIQVTVTSGETQLLQDTYSVQEYAHYLLEGNYTNETKALVKQMLNYGAKAQLYFGYKTDDLANAGYEIETEASISAEVPAVTVSDKLTGISYHGTSMVFESKIAVRHYFYALSGVDGYTFTVDGKAYNPVLKNGYYYIEVTGINPDQMATEMAVSVTKDGGALTFNYSPVSYITRMYNKDSSSAELKAMLLAANGYFEAAKVFTGVAENRIGSMTMAYRYGTNNLIQVNTNIPADTPLASFTTSDNGCSIDESANQYQQVGWIGMDNVDGTIVLTFHFNSAFEAGQNYTLPKGAVFGFADGSRYTLDKNYTFSFNGSDWSMEAKEPSVTLSYRYGTNNLIQFNTDLPSDTPCVNFLTGDNGCFIDESANKYQNVAWIGMENVSGTIVLTFHFNSAFTPGQNYILPAGAIFGFTNGSKYVLESETNLYWDGAQWTAEVPTISFQYRYGTGNLIQVNTDLPSDTPCVNFLTGENGCSIDESANLYQNVAWIGMENVSGTIVLTFNFNASFAAGQTYFLPAGAVFGFTDGNRYVLDRDYTFTFDGTNWSVDEPAGEEKSISLQYRYGTDSLIQFDTDLPATTPIHNFLATDNGSDLKQDANQYQQVAWIGMENVSGTIVLTFHFNSAFTFGQSYILPGGSVFGFADGSSYTLPADVLLYWDDSAWVNQEPVVKDVLDESNFTGGKNIITFADLPVDSNDPAKIEEYKGLGFNTSLLAEDHTGAQGPDERYTVSMETANEPADILTFQYRYGTNNLIQFNTNLPSDTPCVNFTASDNGCDIDQSGNTVQWVGWIGMENVDGTIVLTFHFNNEFEAGQTYVLPKDALFCFTDDSMYLLDADYTFTWDGSNWSAESSVLNFSLNAGAAKYIQLKTNIPTGLSYGDFLLGDTSKGNLILETTEGAQSVGWFSYSEISGAVYLTFNFNGLNKPGTQYTLKAGTSLKAGDKVYTTDRDYILTVKNDYLQSLENLDNAGLNVWIRNYHNTSDYFTTDLTAALNLYKDIIDGFYMADEAFQTNALLVAAGQEAYATDFETMTALRDWFAFNFADKYFHSNHVPISSYDHYTDANGNTLSKMDADAYKAFLQTYKASFNDRLTDASGASISFDNYPFIHAQGTYKYGILNLQSKFESGIQSTYLLNCLLAAQVAAEDDFGMCIQTFEASDLTYKVTRDIASSAEVSLQLYTGMAMGADLFEYFAYNSNGDFDAIMNQDGSKRIYDIVKEGNEALCFTDVVGSFTWNGIMTSAGSVNSHNSVGFGYVTDMVLTDADNGVLSSVASTDDAIIGCFTKDALNGYMVVNFNDPAAVTGSNTVNLTFAGCTRARVYTCVDGVLTSELVELTSGACTVNLAPGSGCFVIPA